MPTTQDSRILIKRSTTTGVVPTIPASNDHTDGSWLATDIYKGEFFINQADNKVFIRTDTGIVQVVSLDVIQTLTNKTLTDPKISGGLKGTNGDYIIAVTDNSGAVNYFTMANAVATSQLVLGVAGTDTNISWRIGAKGSGKIFFDSIIDATSKVINNVADPTSAQDASTKAYTDTQRDAAKSYADSLVVGLWDDRGSFDASVNAYPSSGGSGSAGAIKKGDIWTVTVAGTLPTGQVVEPGDTVRALIDTPGNTQANWSILQNNIGYTPVTNSRTLTINGTTYDLSADRSWSISAAALIDSNVTKSSDFTVTSSDKGKMFQVTTGSSTITATIPSASGVSDGFYFFIRKADSGTGIVVTSPSVSSSSATSGHIMMIWSDGTSWYVRHMHGSFSAAGAYTLTSGNNQDLNLNGGGTTGKVVVNRLDVSGNATFVTQSQGDNSTKAATTAYVDTAVLNVSTTVKYVTADVTTTSNTAGDITDFTFPVAASKRYHIRGILCIGCNNTGGVKFTVTLPSGATVAISLQGTTTGTTVIGTAAIVTAGTLPGTAFCQENNTSGSRFVRFEGIISTSVTSGNLVVQFASGTNTQTSTVFAGSSLELIKLN